jgi:hypothetical protein
VVKLVGVGKEISWAACDPGATGCAAALWCLRFVGLAAAFGKAARCAAVRWRLVRAAVESFGVAAFAQLLLWRVSAGQSCGSFLSGGFAHRVWPLASPLIMPVSKQMCHQSIGKDPASSEGLGERIDSMIKLRREPEPGLRRVRASDAAR